MASGYEGKISEQARAHLPADEPVLAAFIARPRGATTAGAGGGAGAIGGRGVRRQQAAAAETGLTLANPMALALTARQLVVLSVSPPLAFGKGGDVKALVSAVPLEQVDGIEIKRLLVGKVIVLTVSGTAFKLEAGAGADASGFAEAFQAARAALAP